MKDPAAEPAGSPENASGTAAARLPLVVDLDGTLLLTDTLFEAVADHMRTRPLWTLLQLVQLPFAIARVKARLQRGARLDIETLPVNEEVLAYCREAKDAGRQVWLASAADQHTVDLVAKRFPGVFDRVVGSDGVTNNKSGAKAKKIAEELPGGFEYVGDSPADYRVWKAAKAASHVGGDMWRKRTIESAGTPVVRSLERPEAGIGAWRKAMRLHQWAKNALLFVCPILAGYASNPQAMLRCALAVIALGVMASGTYIINDLLDLHADRRHHSKNRRAFASGWIKLWQGFVAAPLMILAGFVGGLLLSPAFAVMMTSYLIITLAYSLMLKRVPLLDAMVLGFLYTLRLMMGAVLTGAAITEWLLVFSMFLFLSLSVAKRHVEVVRKAEAGERRVANRGYRAEDAPLTLALGLATAAATPIILVLYLITSAWPSGQYASPQVLWAAPVILSLWLMRVWLLANRGELDDDPVTFAVRDPISLALGAALAGFFAVAIFGLPEQLAGLLPKLRIKP